ncbi:MAG: hypothetical protein OXT67_13900 [Zetaproteobacteria bacterium]|nr:hypothetical protein [Zetaproteobacteria bacterium]
MQKDICQILDSLVAHALQVEDGVAKIQDESYPLVQEVGVFIFEMFGAEGFPPVFAYLEQSHGIQDNHALRQFWTQVIQLNEQMKSL